MAGDWIKMRTDIYRDPKVCMIADYLLDSQGPLAAHILQVCQREMTVTRNALRNVTVGALVTLWGVTRHRGKRVGDDLVVRGATLEVVDDICDLPGFGEALCHVGWLIADEEQLIFPRFFEEYNVEPTEKGKELNRERQRRHREKRNALRNVTVTLQSNAREEKSREEYIHTHTPAEAAAIGKWREHYRNATGKPFTDLMLDSFLMEAKRKGLRDDLVTVIDYSISKSAKSWIDPKDDFSKRQSFRRNGTSEQHETADDRLQRLKKRDMDSGDYD